MKQTRFTTVPIALLGLSTLATVGCARAEKPTEVSPPPGNSIAATAPARPAIVADAAVASPDLASGNWSDIEKYTYEQRTLFFAGFERLEARVDAQIAELTVKRAAMKAITDTKAWDFAMLEMENARSYLKSMGEEAGKATSETWSQQKTKVGEAWVRTQAAYGKVKSSTTS